MLQNCITTTNQMTIASPDLETNDGKIGTIPLEFLWIRGLAIPTFVIDSEKMQAVAWNEPMEDLSGLSANSVLSRSLGSVLEEGSFVRLQKSISLLMSTDAKLVDCEILTPDTGTRLILRLSIHQSHDEKCCRVVCFAEENKAQSPKGRLDETFPVVIVDDHGRIIDWNAQIETFAGYKRIDVLGRSLLDFVPKRDDQAKLKGALSCRPQASIRSCSIDFVCCPGDLKNTLVLVSTEKQLFAASTLHFLIFSDASGMGEQSTDKNSTVALALHQSNSGSFVQSSYNDAELLDDANVIVFELSPAGYITQWNAQAAALSGFSADEALHEHFIGTFVPPDRQKDADNMIQRTFRGRGTSNFELELRAKDGETHYLLVSTTPRRAVGDVLTIVGLVAFAHDITESWKHDRAVASMANELRLLIDTANAPIFGIDRDGDVNEWNEKTAEITGYTKEEAFDCSLVDTFIVPSMRDSVQEVLDNAVEGRGTSNFDLEFRTKSDEIRHFLVNATTRRDAENNVVGVVGVAQDVTEAVQRDRAVAGMALELRQLIDTANAPIFGIDIDGNVNEWNRRTSEITGYSKEEAFDEPLVETFIAESMQERVREILNSALSGHDTSNYEVEFISKSGEPIFLLVNATTRRDPENTVVGVVGVAQDVTEDRKHAQMLREMQYIRASQEAKVETERNMTAYFAHELRNPLGAIDSALNAMPEGLPESARTLISGMQLCSGFMSSIMNNLLDVRKMEEGKMTLSMSPISLKKILHSVHKMLLPSVRLGVRFQTMCDTKGRDFVLGDSHRIQQVMTNVITNAIKYTTTGSITLAIGWEKDNVRFECIDTGPGIPKNEQEKLFQRFVQRGGAPGTGLGLAIAKHLVDLTGGTIYFDSDPSVRAGTTCVVLMRLPLCDAPEAIVETSTALIEEPISFLIIDDIKMNRMMLKRRILKGIAPQSTIAEAATGEEALEICGTEKFDVVVVDQYMEEAGGVMVGTDVVFAMRRMRIESIIVGCSGNDMATQFFEAGADWVWQKPMPSNSEIIQNLRQSFDRRKELYIKP